MTDRPRGGVFAGILLVGLGLVLLAMQFVPAVRAMDLWSLFPLVVGIAFLAGFAYARQYGFLIPGCILTGLGLGALADKLMAGRLFGVEATVLGLAIGFLAIYPIDLAVRGRQPGQWWPLIPGGIILATSVAPALWRDFWQVAPAVILVVVGIVILVRAFSPGGAERSEERAARRAERRARRHGGAVPAGPAAQPTPDSAPAAADKIEPTTKSEAVQPADRPPTQPTVDPPAHVPVDPPAES